MAQSAGPRDESAHARAVDIGKHLVVELSFRDHPWVIICVRCYRHCSTHVVSH